MLQLTLPSDMKLASGRTIADVEVVTVPSVDSKYVILKTYSGWQVAFVSERGWRQAVAVDCYSKEVALTKCKQHHIERLKAEIKRLGG